jgi:hypothetical protein
MVKHFYFYTLSIQNAFHLVNDVFEDHTEYNPELNVMRALFETTVSLVIGCF